MRLALYTGCTVSSEEYAFEISAREVLPKLGVELVDLDGFSCCGEPLRSLSTLGWLYLSARNISIVEGESLDLLPLCNGCHLSFSETKHILNSSKDLKERINSLLEEEELNYEGRIRIRHVIDILHDEIGLEKIRELVKKPLKSLKLASFYGCHALRPSELGRIDNPERPRKLEELIEVLGAKSPDYSEKLDCCGAGLLATNPEAALTLAGKKVEAVQNRGFDGLITVCPFCQKMCGTKQEAAGTIVGKSLSLPTLYYTQLLGIAMGLEGGLGLELNLTPLNKILERI